MYRAKGVILPVRIPATLKTLRYLVVECGNSYQIQIQNVHSHMLYVLLAILNWTLLLFYERI